MADGDEQVLSITPKGALRGHSGWITAIATSVYDPNRVLTASRDKTIIVWDLDQGLSAQQTGGDNYGKMVKRLVGHHHFVQDIRISSDGQYVISASWDHTLRLWNISTGETTRQFRGHKKDVLSVAFSSDNRQIITGSRDKSIKLWNTLGECKYTLDETISGHNDWVTCVRFSPANDEPVIVSAGCDGVVKVWNLSNCKLKYTLKGHKGRINCVALSPDGSLCASGGKDCKAMLWDLNEGKPLSQLEGGEEINALIFSPNRYWLCAATGSGVKIWDLESKSVVADLKDDIPERSEKAVPIRCISLAWSNDGNTLFAGFTDNVVRVWQLSG